MQKLLEKGRIDFEVVRQLDECVAISQFRKQLRHRKPRAAQHRNATKPVGGKFNTIAQCERGLMRSSANDSSVAPFLMVAVMEHLRGFLSPWYGSTVQR